MKFNAPTVCFLIVVLLSTTNNASGRILSNTASDHQLGLHQTVAPKAIRTLFQGNNWLLGWLQGLSYHPHRNSEIVPIMTPYFSLPSASTKTKIRSEPIGQYEMNDEEEENDFRTMDLFPTKAEESLLLKGILESKPYNPREFNDWD